MAYTNTDFVASELHTTTSFSNTTIPSEDDVNRWIGEADAKIDNDYGRSFGVTSYTSTMDYTGDDRIQLKHAPIVSVTSFLYSTSKLGSTGYGLTNTATEDTDYAVYTDAGEVLILTQNFQPKSGPKMFEITYTAGYATTPKTVQMLSTKLVAKRVIDSIMEQNLNENNTGKSVSVGSISIVKSSNLGINQYKMLQTDISKLEDDLSKGFGIYRYDSY